MGGMCLGSLLLPRFASPRFHPLLVYAVLELGIGIIGIALLFGLQLIERLYAANAGHGPAGIVTRAIVAAICLLPPTLLMGATLPAISRWVEATPKGISWLGFFYGGNILGAVAGCLIAGFYLLRVHDMTVATYVAAAINVGGALIALALAARTPRESIGRTARLACPGVQMHHETPDALPGVVYVAIALSGFTALGAEVVWTRLLSLTLGGTVYKFSIILAVFLIGLGIGSSTGSFLSRSISQPRIALGCCQVLLVGAVGWTAYMIAHSLPYWPINPSLSKSPWFSFQLDMARCLWAILPAAILWGASFPLALAAVNSREQDPGRLVGTVYAANTVGAILGALTFSTAVIPLFGTQSAHRLLIGFSAAAALVLFAAVLWPLRSQGSTGLNAVTRVNPSIPNRVAVAVALPVVLGLAVFVAWRVSPAPWGLTAYGRYVATYGNRLAPKITPEADIPSDATETFCTYLGEGLNGSVAVTKWSPAIRLFHSAGKVQASNEPRDMRLQRLLGHISALLHKKPESVLVVACGAGVTAGSSVVHPEVKNIVICDIEPLVPKVVAPMFERENYGVVNDPRTRIILDDGRHFIRTSQEKFDIITSDPIDPWVKGCASLNTVDYYEMCKAHLKPGGVMTLWVPLYESNMEATKSLIATFFKVLPNGILWSNDDDGEGYDAVLFGQAEPTEIDLDKLQERLDRTDHARVKQSLQDVGFSSVLGLLATYAGRASDLKDWMSDAQINTDRNLRLQYLAGMSLNSTVAPEILNGIIRYYKFPEDLFVGSHLRKEGLRLMIEGTVPNVVCHK